jgi:AraC-like DNA-binding protein
VLLGGRNPHPLAPAIPLNAAQRQSIDHLRHPPLEGPARPLYYQARALETLATVAFMASTPMTPDANARQKSIGRDRVEKTIEILSENLAEAPSLEELGRRVGCSPYHLSRTFSRQMGMTIPQYLRQIRMERAADLLKSGRMNVTEAALEVGYSSLSHFSHAFYETMGCCPGLYPLGMVSQPVKAK